MKGVKVQIGNVTLGEEPSEQSTDEKANPNPVKITWNRKNRIKVHEIPYPADKTIRTSKKSLYTCRMNFKVVKSKIFNDLLDICEDVPLVIVKTGTRPSPMLMYVEDYTFDQTQGYDDDYTEWNITFQQAND